MRRARCSWSDVRGCHPDRMKRDGLGDGSRDRDGANRGQQLGGGGSSGGGAGAGVFKI